MDPEESADGSDADASAPSLLAERLQDVGVCLALGAGGFACYLLWAVLLLNVATAFVGEVQEVHIVLVSPPALGLGMVSAAALYVHVSRDDWSFVDVRLPGLRDAGYAVGGVVVLVGLAWSIDILLQQVGVTAADHGTIETLERVDPWVTLYLVVASIVFIGPGEELLFRNLVQKRLAGSFPATGAIALASVIFALVHFEAYSTGTATQRLVSLTVVFTLSVVLGWLYHRTENLVVVAVVHGVYNAILFALVYVETVSAASGA